MYSNVLSLISFFLTYESIKTNDSTQLSMQCLMKSYSSSNCSPKINPKLASASKQFKNGSFFLTSQYCMFCRILPMSVKGNMSYRRSSVFWTFLLTLSLNVKSSIGGIDVSNPSIVFVSGFLNQHSTILHAFTMNARLVLPLSSLNKNWNLSLIHSQSKNDNDVLIKSMQSSLTRANCYDVSWRQYSRHNTFSTLISKFIQRCIAFTLVSSGIVLTA